MSTSLAEALSTISNTAEHMNDRIKELVSLFVVQQSVVVQVIQCGVIRIYVHIVQWSVVRCFYIYGSFMPSSNGACLPLIF